MKIKKKKKTSCGLKKKLVRNPGLKILRVINPHFNPNCFIINLLLRVKSIHLILR